MIKEALINTSSLIEIIPEKYHSILILLVFTALIVVYCVFIYYFYRILAKKNIINLNLNKYNTYGNPVVAKVFETIFYIIEFIIILPVLTFFWFAVLAVFLLVMSKTENVSNIILIAAAVVASVRVTSYVSENLSQDLAKLLPFILLGLFIVEPNFFSITTILTRVQQVPSLIMQIPYFLLFIVILEVILRFGDLINSAFNPEEDS